MRCELLRVLVILSVAFSAQRGWSEEAAPLPRGHVLFAADFEEPDAPKGMSRSAKLDAGYQSAHALVVERPASGPRGSTAVTIPLPLENMRGYLVHFSAMVKAENVSEKPQDWNGIKFMTPIVTPAGKLHPQGRIGVGSFDWTPVAFPVRVPVDAQQMSLYLGLESVSGKVWFDNIRVTVWKPPFVLKPRTVVGPIFKGHDLPRLRGAMVSPRIDEPSLRLFGAEWRANVIRWQLVRSAREGDRLTPDKYDQWLEGELARLDQALPLCEKYGLYVVVDLHSPPGGSATNGGYAGADSGLFADPAAQKRFVEVWQKIARRYQGKRMIWGYDLANEPIEDAVPLGLPDWQELALQAAKAIRAIDPQMPLIVEPAQGGGPSGLQGFEPLDVPNVIYSVHMYLPHTFTHQGVHGRRTGIRYPGEIDGKLWDKAQLEAALKPVVDFQKNYGVRIYIGEFSAIRWAPDNSAYRYLKDLIEIFEEHDWDWTYHAFRESHGWSVEHGPDSTNNSPVSPPTDRETLLRTWFAKNEKPKWSQVP